MIQSMKLRGALVLISLWFAPQVAFAEARWCTWTNETVAMSTVGATLRCYADLPAFCANNMDCGAGRVCLEEKCVPPCTTIRLAETSVDCGGSSFVRLSGMAPPVVAVPAGRTFAPVGYCTSTLAGPVCGTTWAAWEASYLHTEDTPFATALPQHSDVWGQTDSDGDGCVDGGDAATCDPAPSACGTPQLPGTCTDDASARTCCVVSGMFSCGSCPPSDCSTIVACSPSASVWTCQVSGLDTGACLRNLGDGSNLDELTGICLFPEFLRGCLAPGLPDMTSACFTSPTNGPTTNFFMGDCDGDGCPNGHDAEPCMACDGERCRVNSVDTRVGCGMPRLAEDEPIDPPSCAPDGGPNDAGMMDAPSPSSPDAGRVSFGGGGGCNCTVGVRGQSRTTASLVLFGLIAWAAKRRRRNAA